ncbi:MAG: hypothetical protein ABWK04_03255 [Hydrogenobacter sp.]|uniref:hypothetical protein n=1 Tax=Hydrogenobacter thermophilus TaxID=940 RepID=UPI0030F7C339
MKGRLTKRNLTILTLALSLLMFYIFLNRYYKLRENYYEDYLKHKEIMFLLKNYQERKRQEPTEELLRKLISLAGGEFLSLRQTDIGYEVKSRGVKGGKIPQLVYSLEERGIRIVKFKAVDNTGQGIFDVDMVLR